jgi:hypothetical protein
MLYEGNSGFYSSMVGAPNPDEDEEEEDEDEREEEGEEGVD